MKVVLTGASGTIGSAVLRACLADPQIDQIIALCRRPLDTQDAKLQVLIVKDFLSYDKEVIDAVKDADGCVWALGNGSHRKASEDEKRAALDRFPNYFMQTIVANRSPGLQPLRMAHVGGIIAVTDPNARVWFMETIRREFGAIHVRMLDYAKSNSSKIDVYICSVGFVRPKETFFTPILHAMGMSHTPEYWLANAMKLYAVQGSEEKEKSCWTLIEEGKREYEAVQKRTGAAS